ncbi:hypothetical protein [uncultured Brevundimonas sp.]|uniref:hypothetical protein n=1 Tax=uncultured Brevundimonas sp. TaxID=213418 RepID=UPI0025D45454|nr:hypothetical protein [uncultured Brevundimonas sp.]
MRGDFKATVFAAGCGDAILLEAHNKVVMTDIHYRRAQAQDTGNDDVPDFAPDIRKACGDHHLDVFVSTHPDKDHVGGFCEIFHCGHPDDWDPDPEDDEPKIIVDEIWCSPYGANPHYVTDQAKPLVDEIKRRQRLQGTAEASRAGNRLVVMDTTTHVSGELATGFSWRLLAPTPAEWDIAKAPEGCPPTSSNPTSLVIQWTIKRNWGINQFLILGDTSVEVLERLEKEVHAKNPDHLAWHVLVAPHHCSRRSIGRVWNGGCVDEEFEESSEALKALGEQQGKGFVVASTRRVVRGGNTPPSWHAKQRYLRILANGGTIDDEVKARFRCTGGNDATDKPAHVEFNLTVLGPSLAASGAPAKIGLGGSGAAVGGGGSYG